MKFCAVTVRNMAMDREGTEIVFSTKKEQKYVYLKYAMSYNEEKRNG